MSNTNTVSSPFGTVELTPAEQYRREQEAGTVRPDHDLAKKNAIVAGLAAELKKVQDWEERAEREYRQAMKKRIECTNVLMRAVQSLLNK